MITDLKEQLKQLNSQRELLELEADAIHSELTSGVDPVGIKGPLIDKEGFPRGI